MEKIVIHISKSFKNTFIILNIFLFFTPIALLISQEKGNKNGEETNGNGYDSKEKAITVTGTRRQGWLKDSTITTEVISRKDIDAMGARDLSDTLGNVPGIEVRPAQAGERGETVRLQGLASQNVLILVDGQRTTGRFGGAIDLTRFKAEDIERIEIVKGASSALYGSDAIAGVINVITKEAKDPLQAEFRTFAGTGRQLYFGPNIEFRNYGSIGKKTEKVSTQFTAGWHRGEGYDLTPDATLGPRNGKESSLSTTYSPFPTNMSSAAKYLITSRGINYNPPLESTSGSAFEDLNVSNKTILKATETLTLGFQFYYRYLNQNAVDASPPKAVFDRKNKTHDFMGAFNADWLFAKDWNLNVNANYARFQDLFIYDQRKSDELDKKERTDNAVTELRTRLDRKFSDHHVLSLGAETLFDQISSPRISPNCRRDFPYVCPEDINQTSSNIQLVNGYAARQRTAYYIQDEWRISDKPRIQIVPGIRYDHDSLYGGELLPKLAIRYDLTSTIRIRTASGLGYRAPSFQDLYFNFLNPGVGYRVTGNQNLKPELSRSYNFGAEWEPNRYFSLSINLFHNNVDNLIGYRTNPNRDPSGLLIFQTSNFQRAITQGVETSINVKVHQSVAVGTGYTYTDSKDLLTNLPLEGRGFHRWNVNLRIDHASTGSGLAIFTIVFGKQPFYCQKNPFWCDPQLPADLSGLQNQMFQDSQILIQNLFDGVPNALSDHCAERNLSYCTKDPTYGIRMVNPHTNLNLRIYQKLPEGFQIFAGVDNILEAYDLQYNPQRPRFYYFGIDGKFSASPPKQNDVIPNSNSS
ncbi:TonB-dependent receptor plug domain-containing protein [Leptospira sp. WS92.C1]